MDRREPGESLGTNYWSPFPFKNFERIDRPQTPFDWPQTLLPE